MLAAGTAGVRLKSVYYLGRDELTRASRFYLADGWAGAEPPYHLTRWRQEVGSGRRGRRSLGEPVLLSLSGSEAWRR